MGWHVILTLHGKKEIDELDSDASNSKTSPMMNDVPLNVTRNILNQLHWLE